MPLVLLVCSAPSGNLSRLATGSSTVCVAGVTEFGTTTKCLPRALILTAQDASGPEAGASKLFNPKRRAPQDWKCAYGAIHDMEIILWGMIGWRDDPWLEDIYDDLGRDYFRGHTMTYGRDLKDDEDIVKIQKWLYNFDKVWEEHVEFVRSSRSLPRKKSPHSRLISNDLSAVVKLGSAFANLNMLPLPTKLGKSLTSAEKSFIT